MRQLLDVVGVVGAIGVDIALDLWAPSVLLVLEEMVLSVLEEMVLSVLELLVLSAMEEMVLSASEPWALLA